MKSVLLLYPRLDLFVCSPLLKPGHIHIFEREFNSDILTRYVSLGKLDNRLDEQEAKNPFLRRVYPTNLSQSDSLQGQQYNKFSGPMAQVPAPKQT